MKTLATNSAASPTEFNTDTKNLATGPRSGSVGSGSGSAVVVGVDVVVGSTVEVAVVGSAVGEADGVAVVGSAVGEADGVAVVGSAVGEADDEGDGSSVDGVSITTVLGVAKVGDVDAVVDGSALLDVTTTTEELAVTGGTVE